MFFTELKKRNMDSIMYEVTYATPNYLNIKVILQILKHCIENNSKILLISDPDMDGFCSLACMLEMFRILEYANVEFNSYNNRDHKLNDIGVDKAVNGDYDLVIVMDTASSELDKIRRIVDSGKKLIIFDHHRTPFTDYSTYPKNCYVINTTIENSIIGRDKYRFSAGAVTFTVCDALLKMFGILANDLSAFALISLYSDCMKVSNLYNRSIYYLAGNIRELPSIIEQFRIDVRGRERAFNRRFIIYTLNSKINSLFREERFDLINSMLSKPLLDMKEIGDIDTVHDEARKRVRILQDRAQLEDLGKVLLATIEIDKVSDLPMDFSKIKNYTGLVANRLSDIYGKPCVVVCEDKGSLRDSGSRDMLHLFKKFVECGGHDSAFGIYITDIEKFKKDLQIYCSNLEDVKQNYIALDYDILTDEDIEDMAFYNEFTSSEFPIAYIKLNPTPFKNLYSMFDSSYTDGEYTIKSSRSLIDSDSEIYVRPEFDYDIYLYHNEKIS